MNQSIGYSYSTMILYIIIGIFCAFWLKQTYCSTTHTKTRLTVNTRLFLLWFILVMFAALRLVNYNHVGGTDAYNYEVMFYHPEWDDRMMETDIFFGYTVRFISLFTESAVIYRFICYGIIFFGYIVVIKHFCNSRISYIPFVLLIFPYLRSFNTMRNSIAIAIFLIGIIFLFNRKNIIGCIIIIVSCFFHRMTVLYAMFIPFYFIFRKQNVSHSKKLFFIIAIYVLLGYYAALQIQNLVLAAQLLANNGNADAAYLVSSMGEGIFDRLPMLIQHIALLAFLVTFNSSLPNTSEIHFLRLVVIFDMIVMPMSIVLGMWRAVEYMYVLRLIMWGYLLRVMQLKLTHNSRLISNSVISLCFLFWLYFRIDHEWEPAGLMPYIPFFLS